MATTKEREIFETELLPAIGKHADELRKEKVTGFMSSTGVLYDRELMVVGRAVNGWLENEEWNVFPSELSQPDSLRTFTDKVYASVTSNARCPMQWVTDDWGNTEKPYNPARSAFWRVIKEIVSNIGIEDADDDNWPSHIVYSNLYKVAPAERMNPNKLLCDVQLEGCISLLESELLTNTPRRLLFLTGIDWASDFLERMRISYDKASDFGFVQAIGKGSYSAAYKTKVVVAVHPQGKGDSAWVQDVMKAFRT